MRPLNCLTGVLAAAALCGLSACGQGERAAAAASAPSAASAPEPVAPLAASMPSATTLHYACDGGERIQADMYLTEAGASFVVLHYKGSVYGLSQAISASGARYVGLVGLTPDTGLEWWGKGDHASLSRVSRHDVDDSDHLLDCQAVRP